MFLNGCPDYKILGFSVRSVSRNSVRKFLRRLPDVHLAVDFIQQEVDKHCVDYTLFCVGGGSGEGGSMAWAAGVSCSGGLGVGVIPA